MNESGQSRFEPLSWLLVFSSTSSIKWVDRLVPGRFKHVSAAAWVEVSKAWIVYDVQFGRTQLMVMPEKEGQEHIGGLIGRDADCGVLRMPVQSGRRSLIRWGFWCVPAVKHLLGFRSGALRPDGLWRDCLASGAEIVHAKRAVAATVQAISAGGCGTKGG